jgi:hypothetical protein
MKGPVLLFLGLVLSGCVLQPPTPEEIAARPFNAIEEPAVVCRKEKPTGSNRVMMVCRDVPNAEDQMHTKRTMQRMKRQSEVYAENR